MTEPTTPTEHDESGNLPQCAGCEFMDEPWHDTYLSLETHAEPWIDFFVEFEDRSEMDSLEELSRFIRIHNWQDPVRMEGVAVLVAFFEKKLRDAGARRAALAS